VNLPVIIVLLAGAGAGLGLFLILREFAPGVPALGPALRRLHAPIAADINTTGPGGPLGAIAGRLRIPHRELALIGYSTERYVTQKIGFAIVGLLFPPVFSLLLTLSGIRLGMVIPAAAGLVLAVVFFFLVDVSIRQRAAEAREEFSRHVAVYLDLIALELAASRGPTEALERAAAVGGGWVSQRMRETLQSSRLRLEPPWEGLKQVAAEIAVPDLGDVGDIMTLVGDEGAQVYDTLRSRAESLRASILAKEEERANTATTVLYIPTSLLVFVLFIIAAYPFLVRLITS
jgi:Flp pilus assembly protein TadB